MANEQMQMSAAGMAILRRREHAVLRYYNDVANNCTFGVGTLAHHGPCTPAELQRLVTAVEVNVQLQTRVNTAARAVRRRVRNRQLTQEQFDALVSFTFDTGPTGARHVLDAANTGADARVVQQMQRNIYVHPRDANGRRPSPVRIPGLANRRREEVVPFQALPAVRPPAARQ